MHKIPLIFILSLVLSFQVGYSSPLRYLETNTEVQCIQNGYYDCSKCACDLTEPNPSLAITLCVLSILFSLFFVVGFISIKELREKPGDLLFVISIADILYAVGRILATLTYTDKDLVNDTDNSYCTFSSIINATAISLTRSYHLSFFFYYLTILRTSLKGVNIPDIMYHLIPIIVTGVFISYNVSAGAIGRSIFGICVLRTSPNILVTILTNAIFLLVIYYLAIQTSRSLPECERVSKIRTQFVKFYLRYLIAISLLYIAKGIVDTITGIIVDKISQNEFDLSLQNDLKAMKTTTEILTGLSPIILMLGRMTDPLIQIYWKKIIAACLRKKVNGSELTNSLNDTTIEIKETEMTTQNTSTIKQFQQSRRVEVLYSLLSGIHYFWHVKKMNKLIELAPLRFSPDENDKNEDYIKEASNKRTLFVQEDTLVDQVPELFAEIKEKHYNLARGTLTAYAPRLFEEIIELDDTGRGIRKSLDLKQNFNRILKSGINGGGKSGEFFFFSDDNRFIIKTVSDAELQVFKAILPSYTKYLKLNPNSIIAKIYGIFSFEIAEPNETYNLILMRNINGYPSDCVDRKYDLKGSTVGRIAVKDPDITKKELKDLGVLKDLDFDRFEEKIHIDSSSKDKLYKMLQKDIKFLSSMGLVDYSLAVYVIDRNKHNQKENEEEEDRSGLKKSNKTNSSTSSRNSKSGESLVALKSTREEKYYHIGIIDYLIKFNLRKRSEVFFKKLGALNPNLDISVQKPAYYGERFIKYMKKILYN